MASFFTILIIGISLSMDAFSLALVYGIIGLTNNQKITLSIIVGLYHFIMPLIGLTIGIFINKISFVNLDFIAAIILMYIGVDLILSNLKKEEILSINKIGFLMFGLSVSIDSLSVGVGLKSLTNSYFVSSLIFSITSCFFTYLGLILGSIINKKIGTYSKIVGGIILIIIGIIMLI